MGQKLDLIQPQPLVQSQIIGLPSMHGTRFIPIGDILYCKGESSQSSLHINQQPPVQVNRTLKECQSILEPYGFCRIHKSYLVNIAKISHIKRGELRGLVLVDGTILEISPTHRETLMDQLLML